MKFSIIEDFMSGTNRDYALVTCHVDGFNTEFNDSDVWKIPDKWAKDLYFTVPTDTLENLGVTKYGLSKCIKEGTKIFVGNNETRTLTTHRCNIVFPIIFLIKRYIDEETKKEVVEPVDITDENLIGAVENNYNKSDDDYCLFDLVSTFVTIGYNIDLNHTSLVGIKLKNSKLLVNDSKKLSAGEYVLKQLQKLEEQNDRELKKRNKSWNGFKLMNPRRIKYGSLSKEIGKMLQCNPSAGLFIEQKIDGCRCAVYGRVLPGGERSIEMKSKGGNVIVSQPHLVEELGRITNFLTGDFMIDGEICTTEEEYVPQSEVVGIVNKQEVVDIKLRYIMFDIIYLSSQDMVYSERRIMLDNIVTTKMNELRYVSANPCRIIHSYHEILDYEKTLKEEFTEEYEHIEQELKRGSNYDPNEPHGPDEPEGIVIRRPDGTYDDSNASKNIRKYKFIHDDEFECVGVTHSSDNRIIYTFSVSGTDKKVDGITNYNTFDADLKAKVDISKSLYRRFKNGDYNPVGHLFTVRYRTLNENGIPKEAKVVFDFVH